MIGTILPGILLAGPPPGSPGTQPSIGPEKLFEKCSGAVALIKVLDRRDVLLKQGTGFLVDPNGLIVTNAHVIEGGVTAIVELPGGRSFKALGVVASSGAEDIAILKIDGNSLPFLKLSRALPKQGQRVFAIGNPRGFTNTISDGMLSGIRQVAGGRTLLQVSVPIAPGSSGGPLLDAAGLVVGVTTLAIRDVGNLNFAVPASVAMDLLRARKPPIPLREANVRVGRAPLGPPPEADRPRIAVTRKADGATVAKKAMRPLADLQRDWESGKARITRAQADAVRQKIASSVDGADLTFNIRVANVDYDEKTGVASIYFAAWPVGFMVIDGSKRQMPPAGTPDPYDDAYGIISSWADPLTVPLTREVAAKLAKGSLVQVSEPAQGIPRAAIQVNLGQIRVRPGFCLQLGERYYDHTGGTMIGAGLTINIPRFRLILGSQVLFADASLAEKAVPQGDPGQEAIPPRGKGAVDDGDGKSPLTIVRQSLAKSELLLENATTPSHLESAEAHAQEAKKLLEANTKLLAAEEYAKELSRIDDALNRIATRKRESVETKK